MKSKKIIHLISTIERGGAEKQLLILSKQQIKSGLEVEIIFLKGKPELEKDLTLAGCNVNSFVSNKNFILQIFLLYKYLRKSPTPLHAHLPKSELIAALVCPKKSFIFSRHNSEDFWPDKPKILSRLLSKLVCSRAIQAVAISNAVKNFMLKSGEVAIDYKIDVIYYGYEENPAISSAGLSDLAKNIGEVRGKFKIGAIGRLVDQKDYPTLLRSFAKFSTEKSIADLLIVGEGENRKQLDILAGKLGISESVHFLGRTQYIPEFLSIIDLFVLPSRYEGFGLVLLEAMMAQTVILAADNSSIPEVLGSSYPGLFETGNVEELSKKIALALGKSNFSTELKSNYSNQLQKFDPQIMAKKIHQVYDHSFTSSFRYS